MAAGRELQRSLESRERRARALGHRDLEGFYCSRYVASEVALRGLGGARAAVPAQHRMHARMRASALPRQQPWSPTGALARLADALLDVGRRAPRTTTRPA